MKVASLPHGHVYVEHLSAPDGADGVERLPDPAPENPVTGAPWWPLVMLDRGWIAEHADEFDVYHLHFGFDQLTPDELQGIVGELRRHDKPLVYTVHDLRNPHQLDRAGHDAALDVLVPAAEELVTLSDGAAQEVRERWGREATVIPHPHVVPLDLVGRPRPARGRRTVGIHLKSLRASMNPLPMLEILAVEAPARGLELVVDAHTEVADEAGARHDAVVAATLQRVGEMPGVRVHVHDYYSDEELWEYFRSLDLSVLPYRFGTHSGWLEACYDLGTPVLAPRLGHYHEQHPGVHGYGVDVEGTPVRADVVEVLDRLASPEGLPAWQADRAWREAQRVQIAAAHRQVYQRAVNGGAG